MPLPNPGMTFTPFDPLPASDLNDMVDNIEALADGSGLDSGIIESSHLKTSSGINYELGFDTHTTIATVLSTSYTTYCSITATSLNKPIRVEYGANMQDGASGAARIQNIKVQVDGVDIPDSELTSQTLTNNLTIHPMMIIEHTPTAGSHTWTLQAKSSAAAATFIHQAYLRVTQTP